MLSCSVRVSLIKSSYLDCSASSHLRGSESVVVQTSLLGLVSEDSVLDEGHSQSSLASFLLDGNTSAVDESWVKVGLPLFASPCLLFSEKGSVEKVAVSPILLVLRNALLLSMILQTT